VATQARRTPATGPVAAGGQMRPVFWGDGKLGHEPSRCAPLRAAPCRRRSSGGKPNRRIGRTEHSSVRCPRFHRRALLTNGQHPSQLRGGHRAGGGHGILGTPGSANTRKLRLLAAVRRVCREQNGILPPIGPVDELLDERSACQSCDAQIARRPANSIPTVGNVLKMTLTVGYVLKVST
jgi:hypothetical protein